MFIEDYDLILKRAFLGNFNTRLDSILGIREEGFQIKVYNGYIYMDVFYLYKVNSSHMWSAYHSVGRIYK